MARIHIDQSHWSGILYLSRPEDCQGGTEFFRHKGTNSDRVPMDEPSLKAAGYSSYEELQKEILDKDALDRSKWEHTMTVPMPSAPNKYGSSAPSSRPTITYGLFRLKSTFR